jgi:hypothetical protein
MDESRNILLNYSLKKYLTKDIDIDPIISKTYQCEVLSKYLKNILCYDLKHEFEFKMHLYSGNEYKLNIDDIRNIIKDIYKLTDCDIIFFENLIKERGIFALNTGWNDNRNFLWFKNINPKFYNHGFVLYTVIEFEINIDLMIELLKMRNAIIYLQRKFIDKLYNPKYGKFTKKPYLDKLIKFS